jgi:hypothetical protein
MSRCSPDRQDSRDHLLEKKATTDGSVDHPFATGPGTCRGDTRRARHSSSHQIVGRL